MLPHSSLRINGVGLCSHVPLSRWPGPFSAGALFCRGSAQRRGMANTTATHTSPAPWTRRTSAGCSTTAETSSRGCTSNSTNSCKAARVGAFPPPASSRHYPARRSIYLFADCQPQAMVASSEFPVLSRLLSVLLCVRSVCDHQASGYLCSPQVWFVACFH